MTPTQNLSQRNANAKGFAPNPLTHCPQKLMPAKRGSYVVGSLKQLGVPNKLLYARRGNASFWLRKINFLEVLEAARNCYRKLAKRFHPDKPRGGKKAFQRLNEAWHFVVRAFKQHGYELN